MTEDSKKKNCLRFSNYNKKRHLELLKYSQYLKQQGKVLIHESKDDFLELLGYSAVLNAQLEWEAGYYYLQLLDQLMEKKITSGEFFSKFHQKSIENSEVVDILESKFILLSPHEKSLDFSDFIEEIVDYCESLNNDPDFLGEDYDLSDNDNEFSDSIKEIYIRLKKFLE